MAFFFKLTVHLHPLAPEALGVVVADESVADIALPHSVQDVFDAAMPPIDARNARAPADSGQTFVFRQKILAIKVGHVHVLAILQQAALGLEALLLAIVGGVGAVTQFMIGAEDERGRAMLDFVRQALGFAMADVEGG